MHPLHQHANAAGLVETDGWPCAQMNAVGSGPEAYIKRLQHAGADGSFLVWNPLRIKEHAAGFTAQNQIGDVGFNLSLQNHDKLVMVVLMRCYGPSGLRGDASRVQRRGQVVGGRRFLHLRQYMATIDKARARCSSIPGRRLRRPDRAPNDDPVTDATVKSGLGGGGTGQRFGIRF